MSVTEEIGREILTKCSRAEAENLSEYLTFSGIEPMICLDEDGELFLVAVNSEDSEKAQAIFKKYQSQKNGSDSSAAHAFKRPTSPVMKNVLRRMKRITNSSFFFILCGGFIFALSLARMLKFSGMPLVHKIINITELAFGLGFFIFGIVVLCQSVLARKHLKKESSFTINILRDFLSTYSYEDIDKVVEAAGEDVSPIEARKKFIRAYITREYDSLDPEYIDYLIEEIYMSLYSKRKLH